VDVLKCRLGVPIDDVSLLRYIQTVAVLVQGCWAVKSDLLYPATFVSNDHGIMGPEMQRGRDIIVSIDLPILLIVRVSNISLSKY